MTVRYWIGTLLILAIPIVNLVFLLIWAFGDEDSRKNFSRALLIFYSIIISLSLLLGIIAVMLELSLSSDQFDYNYDYNYSEAFEDNEMINDLVVTDIYVEGDEYLQSVIGQIKNASNTESYSSIFIEFNIYNENNSILDTLDILITATIPPGEVYEFSKPIQYSDAVSVKVIDLR